MKPLFVLSWVQADRKWIKTRTSLILKDVFEHIICFDLLIITTSVLQFRDLMEVFFDIF